MRPCFSLPLRSSSDNDPAINRRWWPALGLMICLACVGCPGDPPATSTNENPKSASDDNGKTKENPCDGTMSTIDDVFDLSRLGRTTTVADGVQRLNDWQRSCAPSDIASNLTPELEKLLTPAQLEYIQDNRFSLRDGEHLRDCLLDKALASHAAGSGVSEIDRVTLLFGYVIRSLGLVARPIENLPLAPFEVYLFGKGTVADRAWLFTNILRQLRIDAVLVTPHVAEDQRGTAQAAPYLIGVLLEGQIYLFDPQAGIPIPAPGGDAKSATPRAATLAQATADPAVLKQLDISADKPYPLTAENLKQPDLLLVSDAAFWSTRIRGLQRQFVGQRAMVIADPLGDEGPETPGLISRVRQATGEFWNDSRVRIWEFPEQRLIAHTAMSGDQLEILDGQLLPFGAYKTIVSGPGGVQGLADVEQQEDRAGDRKYHPGVTMITRTTSGAQMRARMDQLQGNLSQAIREYLEIRDKCREVLHVNTPVIERFRHIRASEDAIFWTGLCQFQQGETRAAINSLQLYRKRSDAKNWQHECQYVLALSLATDGHYKEAAAELQAADPDSPEQFGYQYLIRRWKAAVPAQ
ncbi:MAG: hypothetical protein JSS02_31360 [Planctomycetes bacterium]|nr:hypothetical protein [Planctomycetota bacterium]